MHRHVRARGSRSRTSFLCFVHGSHHGASYWARVQELLADRGWESLAVHLRGARFATIDQYARQTRDACDAVVARADRVVFVGHSQGALVVQALLAAGGAARAAVLMAPVPLDAWLMARHGARFVARQPLGSLARAIVALDVKAVMARDVETVRRVFFLETTSATTRTPGGEGGASCTLEQYYATQITDRDTLIGGFSGSGNARQIDQPVLLIAAESDAAVDIVGIRELAKLLKKSRPVVVVPNQAHGFGDPGWEAAVCGPIEAFCEQVEVDDDAVLL